MHAVAVSMWVTPCKTQTLPGSVGRTPYGSATTVAERFSESKLQREERLGAERTAVRVGPAALCCRYRRQRDDHAAPKQLQ